MSRRPPIAGAAARLLAAAHLQVRVVQCRCGTTSRWFSLDELVHRGWSYRARGLPPVLTWTCSDCQPQEART